MRMADSRRIMLRSSRNDKPFFWQLPNSVGEFSRLVSKELEQFRLKRAGAGLDDGEGDVIVREGIAAGV